MIVFVLVFAFISSDQVLCVILLFDPTIENGTIKKQLENKRLRVVKKRISDPIWTVASFTIAMHY